MKRRAFLASGYEAAGIVARIGQPSPRALLDRLGARCAGFISAENPMARRHPPGWNSRARRRLDAATRRDRTLAGQGGAGRWREHHLLIAAPPRKLHRLARRFRQAALVLLRPGQPARLDILTNIGYNSYTKSGIRGK